MLRWISGWNPNRIDRKEVRGKKGGSFIYRLETDGKKSTQPKGGGWNDERRGENNNKDKFFLYSLLPRGDRK